MTPTARLCSTLGGAILFMSCNGCASKKMQPSQSSSLPEARRGFKSNLISRGGPRDPADQPPPHDFQLVQYSSEVGNLAAYLTPNPNDGKKHPAIIWIAGGDCNSISDVWKSSPRDNDQTASVYRQVGIVMMFPSLRGGNQNPGQKEGFLGEVDDVLAAAKALEGMDYVDPKRIYLAGHSTGGTMAMLAAECSGRFRAVFAFGPVDDVRKYASYPEFLPFNTSDKKEIELRSPGYWLASIKSPTWVLEGTQGNIDSLRDMARSSSNPQTHFIEIRGMDHFATLAPANEIIAGKILEDKGDVCAISLNEDEIERNGSQ